MKLRKLLPIVFLAVTGLAGCGDTNVYDVNIENTGAIIEEWHVGDADRVLSVSATKNGEAQNATQLLGSEIFVTSSNEEVLSVLGFVLKPVAAGDVTVKVEYHSAKFEVELVIRPVRTCIDKYGTVHAGTESDPLDYADAIKIGTAMKAATKSTDEDDIYIKGVVKYWYHFPGERAANDNATSWFIEGAGTETKATELFEMYKVTKEGGATLTDADIWPGAEVLIKGQIGYYNDQIETTKGTFVRVTGGAARVAPETKQVKVSVKDTGALAVGNALEDGDTTWDKYEITGYTVNFLGTSGKDENKVYNYMIADYKDETAASKQFEIYGTKTELKFNAKVKVTSRIKNYHGTIETNMLEKVEVLEEGVEWTQYKEPTLVEDKGLADLFADEQGNYKQLYKVTGTISKWAGTNTDATKYGNFYLKEAGSEEEYYIYGATANAKALKWEVYANKYSFTNPQDFLTDANTKDLKIGDTITMKLTRCDYTKTNEDGSTTVTKEATGILVLADYVAAYAGDTTTNMNKDKSDEEALTNNNAKLIGLDESKFEVLSAKGGASNHVGLNKDGTIRLYSVADAAGNTLTIKAKSGTIGKIRLAFGNPSTGVTNSQYLKVYAGDTLVQANADGSYTINNATVKLVNDAQIKSTQIWFKSISIWMA